MLLTTILPFCILIYYIMRYLWERIRVRNLSEKAIFISGCDSGFGKLLALKCANAGITVFAGCLTYEGREYLKKVASEESLKLLPIAHDVTNDESTKNAVNLIRKNLNGKEFWALINNAGNFYAYGPDDWCSTKDYVNSFNVNTMGMIRTTHAFKPLLKMFKGRIVTITSAIGRVAVSGAAPYCVAKFAAGAYMDALRQEMRPFGVKCCILEPGLFRTAVASVDAMKQRLDFAWQRMPEEKRLEYGEEYKANYVRNMAFMFNMISSSQLEWVVNSYFHAITARFPRLRYCVGWDAIFFYKPLALLPSELSDLIMSFFTLLTSKPAVLMDSAKGQTQQWSLEEINLAECLKHD